MRELSEDNLWMLTAAPLVWAAHLLCSYVTAAVWCAKVAERHGPLADARVAIGAYTLVALLVISFIGVRGWRRHRQGGSRLPHAASSSADRSRFLGFATALLAGLSFLAVTFQALSAAFIGSCR